MSASGTTTALLNPRTKHYEFAGPLGALFVTLVTPATAYALFFTCSEQAGGCLPSVRYLPVQLANAITDVNWWKSLWDTDAAIIYAAWYAFCLAAWAIVPGDWVKGSELRTGGAIRYKINGEHNVIEFPCFHFEMTFPAFSTLLLALGITAGIIIRFGAHAFTFFYDKWVGFLTASLIMAIVQALGCYLGSFRQGKLLALGGNSGNVIYDVRRSYFFPP